MNARVLIVDNYDSFTYNLAQAFMVAGARVDVHRNDRIGVDDARGLSPTHLCISPGPGRPEEAGVSMEMIRAFTGVIPILGVCLGHQSIAMVFGGTVVAAKELMHGKDSPVTHHGTGLYDGLPNPVAVGRYHSLAVSQTDLPSELVVEATTDDGEIMGLRHQWLPIWGVQFHPESILMPDGSRLLENFLGFGLRG
ncbi:MAG: aminodeoxychorismate/anthranilate synthase component II [Myxococcota bacterium]|nr:aminodeoxychorismate/anthranilate synthase component II [Myxococcota bacterium]MEC9389508.1 aminodeoxychorismate/anthranilate synthase component II [Myxococcota bacterium]